MNLTVSNITYLHPDTKRGCSNVSFTAQQGDLTVLVAPSGYGKTTALAAIAGLLIPQQGSVLLDGKRQLALGDAAFIMQTADVFENLKAWENVACAWGGPSNKTRARAVEELERYGLTEIADSFPSQLSGGQQQRVAIISALAQKKQLILADEVTSHLDDANADLVTGMLKEAARSGIVVVASHDRRLLSKADRVVDMREGQNLG